MTAYQREIAELKRERDWFREQNNKLLERIKKLEESKHA